MELTAVLTPAEEGGYIALNPETGTTTQGETVEEAIANLTEATTLYLSEFPLPAPGHPIVTMFSVPTYADLDTRPRCLNVEHRIAITDTAHGL
jgi:predicted RNase H-like HicB family nuclease